MDENEISYKVRNLLSSTEEGAQLKVNDASKIIGCYKALSKIGFNEDRNERKNKVALLDEADSLVNNLEPMKRALGFCSSIKISKLLEEEFSNVVNEYIVEDKKNNEKDEKDYLHVEAQHVDGLLTLNKKC